MSDSRVDALLLAATSLDPDGVRAQWLEPVVPSEHRHDIVQRMRAIEAAGLVSFHDDALHVTDAGRERLAGERFDAAALHAALADGIARSSYGSASARERLARHLAASGDVDRAQSVLLARAAAALRTCEPMQALHAMDQAATLGPLDPVATALHARCAKLGGDPRTAALWSDALERATLAGDEVAAARAVVERVLLGAETPDALLAHAHAPGGWGSYATGLAHYFDAAWEDAIDALEQALAHARTSDDLELETAALRLLANAHAGIGHLELSARVMRDAIRVADLASDPFTTAIAYMGLVETLIEALHTDAAADAAHELERYLETRGIERLRPLARALRAGVALAQGRCTDAFELARRALAGVDLEQVTSTDGYVANVCADAIAACGQGGELVDAMLQHVTHIIDAFRFSSASDHLELAHAWRARTAGDAAPLLALAERIDPDAELVDAAQIALILARGAVLDGDVVPSVSRLRSPDATACPLASAAWQEVDAILARDHTQLDAVATRWHDAGRGLDAALATLVRARLEHDAGCEDDAERSALHALRELVAAGARHEAERARALIASIGRMPADPSGLLGCSAFAHLDARVLTQLVHDARRIEVPAGAVVPTSIDGAEIGIAIIGDGTAFVVEGADGDAARADDLILAVRRAGDAHVDAWYRSQVAAGAPSTTRLVAGSALVVWAIPAATVRSACIGEPRLIGALLAIADEDAAEVRQLAAELATLGFQQRLARLLLRLQQRHGRPTLQGEAMIDAVITNEQLARMCGSQRPRVSTLIAAWKRDGILEVWRRRLVIRSSEPLRALAGLGDAAGEQGA